ncbi:MAG TPA: hypothetical protein VK698_00805 [Kofleriaceae bacterium]|nr:hypothetical protein [Kofleriaceae bacterium]
MKFGWLVALAALLVPAAASAQSADAGPDEAGEGAAGGGEGGDDLPPMMRDPRQLSGIARGEANDPAGRLTVRAVQGAMKRSEFGDVRGEFPVGTKIHLVGLGVGGKVTHKALTLDSGGRAVFDGLATNFAQSYVALAIFPRPGAEDRLVSQMVSMPPQVGTRMMLAGEAVASGKPAVDDLVSDDTQVFEVPAAGTIVVYLRGDTKDVQEIELLEAGVDTPVARTKVQVVSRTASVDGRVSQPEDDRALRAGLLEVLVSRRGEGIADIPVEIVVAGAAPGTPAARTAKTDASGRALFEPLPAGKKYLVRAPVEGRPFESAEFAPPGKTGQRVRVDADWREAKGLEARFTGIQGGPDKVFVARAVDQPRPFLTMPFQLTSSHGAATNLVMAPPVLFAFHGGANLEDEKLYFQLQISIYNASVLPYEPPREGLRIPLPRGFSGASVEEEVSARVKVDENRGLVWRGLIPPGERRFIASFALGSVEGKASFDMAMPYGLWPSQIVFEKMAGLRIDPPSGVKPQVGKTDDGRPLVIFQNIQLDPGASLHLGFAGLPTAPHWQRWVARSVGVLVLSLMAWGIWGLAIRGRRGGGRLSHLEAEREELLQAVVQLEADLRRQRVDEADYKRRRAELQRQLEGTYAELATEEKEAQARAAVADASAAR